MGLSDYYKSLSELKVGDDVVLFNQIRTITRVTKTLIVIQYGNMERKFRIRDGYESSSSSLNCPPRIIPITDKLRARINLKNDKDLLKYMFSRTIDNLDQDAVTEMIAILRVHEK